MKSYSSLFKLSKKQPLNSAFAHFYPDLKNGAAPDYDEPFKAIARQSMDGFDSWTFTQQAFKDRHKYSEVPKLKNYLNYTFVRLLALEQTSPGQHFVFSNDNQWVTFNTGLQNSFGADLYAIFQAYKPKAIGTGLVVKPDWVYKGCNPATDRQYREVFGNKLPKLAWYSTDSKDYVFDTSYSLDKDAFDHLFERAKERAGLPNATDEAVRNYLRGAIENLVPKIVRNYKVAIPVYYVEEKRMQMLLPFVSADSKHISAFLVDRDDQHCCYKLKTIFDLDHAYFAARLITRPDKDWLNP